MSNFFILQHHFGVGVPLIEFSLATLIIVKGDKLSRQVLTTLVTLQGFNLSIKFQFYNILNVMK